MVINLKDTNALEVGGLVSNSLGYTGARIRAGASNSLTPACSTRFETSKWCRESLSLELQSNFTEFAAILPHNLLDKRRMN